MEGIILVACFLVYIQMNCCMGFNITSHATEDKYKSYDYLLHLKVCHIIYNNYKRIFYTLIQHKYKPIK